MKNTIYTMATAFDASGNVTAWLTEPDPAIVPIVAEATALAAELGSVVLGTATADFGRAVRGEPGAERPPSLRTAAASRRSATSSPTCRSGR